MTIPYGVLMPLAPWEPPENLAMALESLRAQTCPPSQVVVSCDGEPPPSLRRILDDSGLSIDVVLGPGSEGVGPVLARGIQLCRYEILLRADADDISLPERCEQQVCWLKEHPHVVALGSVIAEFRDAPDVICHYRCVPTGSRGVGRWARFRNPLNHPSVALRRSAVLAAGNYRSRPGFEDYDLWLRFLALYGGNALANLPEALVLARVGEAHLARRHGFRYARAEWRFFWGCGREKLLLWSDVCLALLMRIPLRIFPVILLSHVMAWARCRRPICLPRRL
jgi:glycosyltransferase involved in cell wall biosynthesis